MLSAVGERSPGIEQKKFEGEFHRNFTSMPLFATYLAVTVTTIKLVNFSGELQLGAV